MTDPVETLRRLAVEVRAGTVELRSGGIRAVMADAIDAVLARLAEAEANKRTFICLWCAETFDAGCTAEQAHAEPSLLAGLYERATAHDQQCPKNPLAARLAEAERALDEVFRASLSNASMLMEAEAREKALREAGDALAYYCSGFQPAFGLVMQWRALAGKGE